MSWPSYGNAYSGAITISLQGVASEEAVGQPKTSLNIATQGVSSEEAVGQITYKHIIAAALQAIGSQEVVGQPTVLLGAVSRALLGIASEESLGQPRVAELFKIVGLPSGEGVGQPSIVGITSLLGVASQEAVGQPTVIFGPVYRTLQGIPTAEAIGQPTIKLYVPISGIASAETIGLIKVSYDIPGIIVLSPAPLYRVEIADLNGNRLEEVPFSDLSYSFVLNDAGACSFSLPLTHPKTTPDLLAPGQREVHVYREGNKVWGGYLWVANVSLQQGRVSFAAQGYFSRLRYRFVDETKKWEDLDQLEIAWKLINFTQNKTIDGYVGTPGDLGITRGNPAETSGIIRTRKYFEWERVNIAEELQSLTELRNGFDFDITPNKVWRTWFPQRGNDEGHIFELGKNIEDMDYDRDATQIVSQFSALGAGDRKQKCIATVAHTTSLSDFGLMQGAEDFPGIKHYDTLVDKSHNRLGQYRRLLVQPRLTVLLNDPTYGEVDMGDTVLVRANAGYLQLNEDFRVVTQEYSVTQEGRELVNFTLDRTTV